jgi:hypothetical protein
VRRAQCRHREPSHEAPEPEDPEECEIASGPLDALASLREHAETATAQNVPNVESRKPTANFTVFSGTRESGRCAITKRFGPELLEELNAELLSLDAAARSASGCGRSRRRPCAAGSRCGRSTG